MKDEERRKGGTLQRATLRARPIPRRGRSGLMLVRLGHGLVLADLLEVALGGGKQPSQYPVQQPPQEGQEVDGRASH
eukprot:3494302-Pyramimonas_sp.AAC.1